MDISEVATEDLLKDRIVFLVPLFQRSYSWNKTRWDDLWDDLIFTHDISKGKELGTHFMGAIVTKLDTVEANKQKIKKFLLIDGQQRITTLTLLLCALRDSSKSLIPDDIASIQNFLFTNLRDEPKNTNAKLVLSSEDQPEYYAILTQKEPNSKTKISACYNFFKNKIDSDQIISENLLPMLTWSLTFVNIELKENEDPYRIFESLNAKSTPLSQSDLVKNYIFMHIAEDKRQQVYESHWRPVESLAGNNLNEFVWLYTNTNHPYANKKSTYSVFRKKFRNKNMLSILYNINAYADLYAKISQPTKALHPKIRDAIKFCTDLGVPTAPVPVLNLMFLHRKKKINMGSLISCLNLVESFVFRRMVAHTRDRGYSRVLRRLADWILKYNGAKGIEEYILEHLSKLEWPDDEQFLRKFKTYEFYGKDSSKCRFALSRIECHLGKDNRMDTDYHKVSIEHIMPRKLTKKWFRELGRDAVSIQNEHLNTIGNLTLSGSNRQMSNKSFEYKKEFYKKDRYLINNSIIDKNKWNKESVLSRADTLAHIAIAVWPKPPFQQAIEE